MVPMWMLVLQMSNTWTPRDRTRTCWLAIVGYRADFMVDFEKNLSILCLPTRVDRLVSQHVKRQRRWNSHTLLFLCF